jgi:hypothetical protein
MRFPFANLGSQVAQLKNQVSKELTPRQEQLLREFDDGTASSGKCIARRLAEATGSAFEKYLVVRIHHPKRERTNKK